MKRGSLRNCSQTDLADPSKAQDKRFGIFAETIYVEHLLSDLTDGDTRVAQLAERISRRIELVSRSRLELGFERRLFATELAAV
jgi:hypothetical protein